MKQDSTFVLWIFVGVIIGMAIARFLQYLGA